MPALFQCRPEFGHSALMADKKLRRTEGREQRRYSGFRPPLGRNSILGLLTILCSMPSPHSAFLAAGSDWLA